MQNSYQAHRPSFAFVATSWAALLTGLLAFLVGLFNANMQLNERGYYFTVLVYGLFAAVSVQKSVRDRLKDIPVTGIYHGLNWISVLLAVLLPCVGLFNATLALGEKDSHGMSFALTLFDAIAVQENTRDIQTAQPLVIGPTLVQHVPDVSAFAR